MDPERAELRTRWLKLYNESVENDSWGQVLEALDGYDKLLITLEKASVHLDLTPDEKIILGKLHVCLQQRVKSIRDKATNSMPLDQFKRLKSVFESLFTTQKIAFPLDVTQFEDKPAAPATFSPYEAAQGGSLLPPPAPFMAGEQALTIYIEKIGLKDAQTNYVDPFITVSVVSKGVCLERTQDTPIIPPQKRVQQHILFGNTVYIQTPLQKMPSDCTIFFEFKHYKPKQRKVSTRCWAMLEMDEMNPGPIALEIYRKPTDLNKKSIKLFSVKPLYLHLNLTIK